VPKSVQFEIVQVWSKCNQQFSEEKIIELGGKFDMKYPSSTRIYKEGNTGLKMSLLAGIYRRSI
jgi:hypothetical protein